MKKILVAAGLILSLAACTQTEKGAAIGAVTGGIIGGAITDDVGVPRSARLLGALPAP